MHPFPKIQNRLDNALPRIARLLEEFGRQPPEDKVGNAPLRQLSDALDQARQILSREPGAIMNQLFYTDGTTAADAVLLLRHARDSLKTFAHRRRFRARW